MNWTETINSALQYIEENINNTELSPDSIASKINFSTAHFNRAFNVLTGLTVSEYIRNRRLYIAGKMLKETEKTVLDVAFDIGYETPEAFSKAFKRFHNINPSESKVSKLRAFYPIRLKLTLTQEIELIPKIIDNNEVILNGEPNLICSDNEDEITSLWEKAEKEGIINNYYRINGFKNLVGVYHNGQYSIKALCCYEELHSIKVQSGKWAVFSCHGNMPEAIDNTWDKIYSSWIINCHYKISDLPQLEVYKATENGYECEIWIPIEFSR